ncbi:MAG: outer membrane protein transport protein [Candidatus Latescibacterota bacterium]|nr:MAG: outer membrane protein transport protein [Candidatus Latescibacterota bacterium]
MRRAKIAPSDPRGKKKKRMASSPILSLASNVPNRVSGRGPLPKLAATILVVAALLGATGPVHGQDINEVVTFEDLGFTYLLDNGARAAGMAGAYNATAEDVYSMVYNPAGLARIRRIEASLGFQHSQTDLTNDFYGTKNDVQFSSTKLDALAAAYPIPTYRGSLVLGGGVFRIMSSDLQILNRGLNTSTDTYDDYLLQQTGSVYSYNLSIAADLSPAVSLGLNGYVLDGNIKALTQFSYEFVPPLPDEPTEVIVVDDARADLDGYGATVGAHYHPLSFFRIGLSVTTPIKINLRGSAIEESAYYWENEPHEFYTDQFVLDSSYRIPFRVNAGAALMTSAYSFAADVGYIDWRQAEVNGLQLKDEDLNAVFRETVNLRAGGEVVMPFIPIRIRAGYAYLPYATAYLQTDRISGDQLVKSEVETERQLYSAGVGVLLGRVLTIDASYEYETGKRVTDTLIDERKRQRLVLTGSYRF